MKRKRLGEVLHQRGKISADDLNKALQAQQDKLAYLGEVLLERGLVSKDDLVTALEEVTHVPYVDCLASRVEPEALRMVPQGVAERCCVLPLYRQGSRLVTVMAEPQNLRTLGELHTITAMEVSPRLGFRGEIYAGIEKWYSAKGRPESPAARARVADTGEVDDVPEMEFVTTSTRQSNIEAMQEVQAELLHRRTPAVRLVSGMLAAAMHKGASDLHIEPQSTQVAVRIRVDGVLRDLQTVPRTLHNSLVSRIKILSDMDIAERRVPQDGRFLVRLGPKRLDLRVSTLPTQYGEKVVMRLLEPHAPLLGFRELGLSPEVEEAFTRLLRLPQGLLLVTGPTSSGKSTTLYAALNLLRRPTVNIVTVEDPVEYVLEGINQVHVNVKAGLTFASCLRSILRQDPNVIMVGEIRDGETAEIAMKAAQTGHLVLSTLHTNDSIAAITRLLDLGVPGEMLAASTAGIVAQRLVRRLCACGKEVPATPHFQAQLAKLGPFGPARTERVPVGCRTCDHTGYKGRVGIYELLVFDEAMRRIAREAARTDEMRSLARIGGMRQMQQHALELVKAGRTTLEEVSRVVPFEAVNSLACTACGSQLGPTFRFCPHCGATQDHRSGTHGPGKPKPALAER